jgi:hypothetical protein
MYIYGYFQYHSSSTLSSVVSDSDNGVGVGVGNGVGNNFNKNVNNCDHLEADQVPTL